MTSEFLRGIGSRNYGEIESASRAETMHAGESFIIPKGMPCMWT